MELLVCFLTRFSKLHPFWRDEISKYLFFRYVFGTCVKFFLFWWAILGEGCQKSNICLQMIFLKRWQVSRNSFFLFLSLIAKILTFGIKLCMLLKTEFQVITRFFRGKECINENLNTWFLPEIERKTAPSSLNFFWRSVKRQSMTAEELLEKKVKFETNFDSLCHKFLAWVSFLLSTCPGEPFEEENASIN